ncbi:hypothetical protein [Acetobacter indonesiensis]|uniref:hypothetical protein n=1 Tax=Acetobacter indonesiensis TaxID=104101 RepID=UPI0020A325F3|nr:hypothetical protein [Acetobacter indonesiensis]MCP1229958.1 hypothetical protein [Acetobacter indonesiensis]
MPMLPVSLPSVWTVPVAAGVPLLLGQSRATGAKAAASVTIGTVLEDALVTTAAGQWGIFNNAGQNVLSAARVMSVGGEATHHIASAPLEDGGFLSYSKVASPRLHRVLMVCDGSETGFNTNSFSSGLSQAVSTLTGEGICMCVNHFLKHCPHFRLISRSTPSSRQSENMITST